MPLSPAHRAETRAVLGLGLPLIGSHLAQFAIGATDTLMLGWYNVTALAGGVLGASFFYIFLVMGAGFAWAVMPMVAAATEASDAETRIRRVTRMGLWLSVLFALLALPLLLWSEPLFLAIGQTPEVAAAAGAYLRIAGWGLIPGLGVMLLKSYLSALERARVVLWVTLAAVIVNALLNWVLIFGHFGFPELGIQGSAIASVAVHVVSMALLIVYAARTFPEHSLFQRLWRPDWEAFGTVFRLGWPIGLTSLAEVGLFSFSAIMVGWLGTLPLAAHGIALQLASATFMIHLGLSNAATVRAGKAVGRGDPVQLRCAAEVSITLSVIAALLTVIVFLTIPEPLLKMWIAADDPLRPDIVALGVHLMVMAALFQTVDGLQVIALGLLRGAQDTRVPMMYAAVSYWGIGVPAGLMGGFALGWGAVGVWAGLVVGLSVAAVLLMHRFWRRALPSVLQNA